MRRILTLLILAAACLGARGQHPAPEEYIYPIRDVEGLYSANFGEMRPAHFHAGIDIKTDGAEGKPLVAVADGYVSRVSLGAYGYGRAVYLTLHNGTTAVYGHLQRFRKDIEERVREERHARRSNSVNLWFGPDTWPVKQGDVIGYSGNSGSSMGPHLHYELRDTRTQRLYNVVSAGIIRPDDDLPPAHHADPLHRGRHRAGHPRAQPPGRVMPSSAAPGALPPDARRARSARGAKATSSSRPATAATAWATPSACGASPCRPTASPFSNTAWTVSSKRNRAAAMP